MQFMQGAAAAPPSGGRLTLGGEEASYIVPTAEAAAGDPEHARGLHSNGEQ